MSNLKKVAKIGKHFIIASVGRVTSRKEKSTFGLFLVGLFGKHFCKAGMKDTKSAVVW